jgi:hypothetical protein
MDAIEKRMNDEIDEINRQLQEKKEQGYTKDQLYYHWKCLMHKLNRKTNPAGCGLSIGQWERIRGYYLWISRQLQPSRFPAEE